MAAQRLPEGQIVPQAKPVSAFIEPEADNIAQPNAPSKIASSLQINKISMGSTPSVQGSYDGLARQLADFNRNLVPALSSLGLAYAGNQIAAGEQAAREEVLRGLANNDAAMETAEQQRAAANRQVAAKDPQAGQLMSLLNPYRQIGYERGMSKAAGDEAQVGLQAFIAKNIDKVGGPGYNDPDQGYSKLVQLQAQYTAELSEKYKVKLGSPGFQRYALPEINKAYDRVLTQHSQDRKNYFDTAAVQQAASQVEAIYRNGQALGYVDVGGQTFTRAADPIRFEEMLRYKANAAVQSTVLNASLPGEASARSEKIYTILSKSANYEVDDKFKGFIDSMEGNQFLTDENGKAVMHPGTNQAMRMRWGEQFKGEAIDIEMKYEKAGMERRREQMVESADGFRDNLLAIASAHDPGPGQQQAINSYVMDWWQKNGRAAGISLSELQKIRTEVVKLDDDIYQEGQDPNVAGNFFTQLNATYGSEFNATAQRQALNDAASQILDRKEREQFLREGSAQIASREKEMASFAGYNTARNEIVKRAVDSNLAQYYDQSLAGDDPSTKANIDASKTRQMSAFTQRANDLIAAEEARLKRRLTDSEVRQLTTAAIYGDADRKIPAYGAGDGGKKQKEYLFPGSDRTDTPGVASVYDDPAMKKTYGLADLNQLQPRKRLQSYKSSPILTKEATLQAWGFVQKGKSLPRMLDLAVKDSGAPSAGAFVLAQMDLWKRQLARQGASKADLQKFDPAKDVRERVLKNGQRVSAAGNNVNAQVAMAPRQPLLQQIGNWAMNSLTGSSPAVAATMPTAVSTAPTAPMPQARPAARSTPMPTMSAPTPGGGGSSRQVAPPAPVLPAPVGGGGALVASAPRVGATALAPAAAPAGGGGQQPVGQLTPTGVGGWVRDEAGNIFSSSAPLPPWAGTGRRLMATRVPMDLDGGGGGGGNWERPSSVNFEGAGGQPGVDLYFESKRFPAVLGGVVKDVSFQGGPGSGYGRYVVVESTDPLTGKKVDVLYGHLAEGSVKVRPGQRIAAGQQIGTQGGTGRVISQDGTIASIDFLAPAPAGSGSMTPYSGYDRLRRHVVSTLQKGGSTGSGGGGVGGNPAGYLKRLAYLETRIRNIPNSEGSGAQGYFQAMGPFNQEAIAASGGISPRDGDYNRSAKATWAWIEKHRPAAAAAIKRGDYDAADRILRPTWPSLPGGDQAQSEQVQREARRYLGRN